MPGAGVSDPRAGRLLVGLLATMTAAAWLLLWRAGTSPYLHGIHHGHLPGPAGASSVAEALVFVASWSVMTVAMMLPTSLPLIALFARVTADRSNRVSLAVLLVAGYLSVWIAAGAIAFVLATLFRRLAAGSLWLEVNPWALGSAAFIVAGAFQFSSLKYACLDRCRSPFSFLAEHWSGRDERADALRLGLHHGLFCVGCCWALMLVMIPLGAGNLGWMLALAALMAVEKNTSWGRLVVKPIGVLLILIGIVVAIAH